MVGGGGVGGRVGVSGRGWGMIGDLKVTTNIHDFDAGDKGAQETEKYWQIFNTFLFEHPSDINIPQLYE